MKQPKLKKGQQYRVIKDSENKYKKGTIITVKRIILDDFFRSEEHGLWDLEKDKLQLIKSKSKPFDLGKCCKCLKCGKQLCTCGRDGFGKMPTPKSKRVKKWKNNRSKLWLQIGILILNCRDYKLREKLKEFRESILAKQSQPIKQQSKDIEFEEIKPIDIIYDKPKLSAYNSKKEIVEKINEIINSLNKRNIK